MGEKRPATQAFEKSRKAKVKSPENSRDTSAPADQTQEPKGGIDGGGGQAWPTPPPDDDDPLY